MNPTLQHRRPIQDFFPQPLPAAPHPRIACYIPPMATVNPNEKRKPSHRAVWCESPEQAAAMKGCP